MVSGKLAKIMKIFVDMGHIKTKGHILAQKNWADNSHTMEWSQLCKSEQVIVQEQD